MDDDRGSVGERAIGDLYARSRSISRLSIIELFVISTPMPGQHDVGCDQEPKRILTYKWNIDKYRNQCEPGDDE